MYVCSHYVYINIWELVKAVKVVISTSNICIYLLDNLILADYGELSRACIMHPAII